MPRSRSPFWNGRRFAPATKRRAWDLTTTNCRTRERSPPAALITRLWSWFVMEAIGVTEFGGPEVLKVQNLPEPHPGMKEVRIRVRAAAVSPTDTNVRTGAYDMSQSEPPYMPGMDAAGVIDEVGEGSAWNIGDEVMAIALPLGQHGGAHAEYLVARDNATPQLITPGQGRSGDSWDHADRPGGHDCRGSHQHPLPGVCRGRARGNEGDRDVRRGTPRRDDHSRLSATCNHDASRKS
ncbi:MAG: NADP-dependent oxidoreductase [Micrococcaceae bacterium]|nr:NADP-dependent oxidoreductase [Micrococcaceae bacterium]